MTNLMKPLAIAALSIAMLMPAKAEPIAGNFPYSVPIYNKNGDVVGSGIPNGRFTNIYNNVGKYYGRSFYKAMVDGQVISLFEMHIGCTDQTKAEKAWLVPDAADRNDCELLLPSKPYTIVQEQRDPRYNNRSVDARMLCLRPQGQQDCRWVVSYVQVMP